MTTMTKNTIYILVALVAMLTAACDGDKGNYDYHELNEPTISGVADSMSVLIHSTLSLDPDLGENITDTAAYTYQWRAINKDGEGKEYILGQRKELNYTVTMDAGEYTLYFTMTDKQSGLFWRTSYALTVSDPTSEGWMILCDDNGKTRLDIVSTVTGKTYTDVLATNGMQTLSGPRSIQYFSTGVDNSSPFYLFTDDGATRLAKNNFGWKQEYLFRYEVAQSLDLRPYRMTQDGGGFGRVVVSDGKAYYAQSMGIQGLFGSAANKDFSVAPYVGANVGATVYAAVYLLYDTTNKRFMAYCPMAATNDLGGYDALQTMDDMGSLAETLHPGAGVTGTAFSEYPTGLDFVYMENTKYDTGNAKMGLTYTLLRNGANYYLYGIQLGDLLLYADCTFVLGKAYYGDLSGCRDIDKATCFAFSSLRNYMYYAVEGTIYRVDLAEKPLTATRQMAFAGETVTRMKFNLYKKTSTTKDYDLIVATQNNTTGKGFVRIYDGMTTEGDFSSVTPTVYSGFAKVVDVTYRERTN